MGKRNGFVNSAQSRMCGRGGVVGAATMTSPQGCVGSTSRLSLQGSGNGLRALRRQAGRKIESPKVWRQKIRSFWPGVKPWRRRDGKEPKEGKAFHPGEKGAWRKSGDWTWTSRMRSRAAKSLQKELRDVEKPSCIPKEVQDSLKNVLQQQLQEVEQRRHDLMPEHQKAQKRSQKIQSTQDKRRNLKKDSTAAEEEMRKLQEELKQKEERILFLPNKVDKNKMADAEMAAELQRLQAEEERRTAMLRKQVIAAWRPSGNRLSPWKRTESRPRSKGIEKWELPRGRCQEEKKEEGTAKMNKITVKPVSRWCFQRKAGSMKALQRVVWSLIFLVFGVRMVNAEEQGAQVQQRTEKDLGQIPRGVDFRWKRMR